MKHNVIAFLLFVGLSSPIASSAETLIAIPDHVRLARGPVEFVQVDTRLNSAMSFQAIEAVAEVRVAYIEGFGPVAPLNRWLRSQNELEELNIICIQLSDADIDAIMRLPKLERLSLRGCRLSNSQIERLNAIPSIREFDLLGISLASNELASRQ